MESNKIKYVTGVVSLIYYLEPIIQDYFCKMPIDRYNDHFIFIWPLNLYQSLRVIAYGNIIPFIIQFLCFVLTWLILYWLVRLIMFIVKMYK